MASIPVSVEENVEQPQQGEGNGHIHKDPEDPPIHNGHIEQWKKGSVTQDLNFAIS